MKDIFFIKTVWEYYKKNKRPMPWRNDVSPYSIFVSEVMLQQTRVSRVLIKYSHFINIFPSFQFLAESQISDILSAWQGMGYNRRALYLKAAARIVCTEYSGHLPEDPTLLDKLPGIGRSTACSIAAFAFNKPVIFIETNIRRVFIHHYFADKINISDSDILPYVGRTLDKKNPREWYWALMDYGAYLATQIDNPNKKSKHYIKQKKFKGSIREIRGGVLKLLLKRPHTLVELENTYKDERLITALEGMKREGLVREKNKTYLV